MVGVEFVDGGGAQGIGLLAEKEGEAHRAGGEEVKPARARLHHGLTQGAGERVGQPAGMATILDGG